MGPIIWMVEIQGLSTMRWFLQSPPCLFPRVWLGSEPLAHLQRPLVSYTTDPWEELSPLPMGSGGQARNTQAERELWAQNMVTYTFCLDFFFFFFRRRDVMGLGMKLFKKHRSWQSKASAFFLHSLSDFFPNPQRQILGQPSVSLKRDVMLPTFAFLKPLDGWKWVTCMVHGDTKGGCEESEITAQQGFPYIWKKIAFRINYFFPRQSWCDGRKKPQRWESEVLMVCEYPDVPGTKLASSYTGWVTALHLIWESLRGSVFSSIKWGQ